MRIIRGFSIFLSQPPIDKMAASGQTAVTDRELRAELKRLGFSAGPVTDTTRQVYLKKLGKLQAEEKSKAKAPKPPVPGRKLLGFSSDESDGETAGSRRRSMPSQSKSLRRRSTKARPAQTPYNGTAEEYGDAVPKYLSSDSPGLNSSTKSKRYSTGMLPSGRSSIARADQRSKSRAADMFGARGRPDQSMVVQKREEFSDSDVDGDDDNEEEDMEVETVDDKVTVPSNNKDSYTTSTNMTNTLNQTYTKDHEANDSSLTGKRSSGLWWYTAKPSPRRSLPASTPRTSTPRKSNNRLRLSDAYNDEVDASKLSTTQNNSNALAPISRNNLNSRYPNLDHSIPGSSKSNKTPTQTSSSSFLNSKSNHTPGRHSSASQPVNSRSTSKISDSSYPEKEENLFEEFATEDHSASSLGARIGHYVPMILLSCAFLFFIVLAMVYMNVGNGNLEDIHAMYIADNSGSNKHGFSEENQHMEAMRIVQALYDKLSELAGKHECGLQDITSRKMTFDEAQAFLKYEFREDIERKNFWLTYHFKTALQKMIINSQWGIRLLDANGELLVDSDHAMDTIEDNVTWLESEHLSMSWMCRVQRSAALVVFRLFLFCLAVLVLWLLYKYILYRMRRDKEEKNQVHQLVDSITEMLASHHKASSRDKSLLPYLAIPHVRDTIIPLKYRKEKQHLWDRAVHFINTNESRVRVETQQVAGEEFLVWRWMLPSPVVSSFTPITELELNPNRVKVWQGTAFDNLDTAIKAPRYTPTPCLKIRNMFDPTLESDGDWHVTIEDAILERCGDNGGIVHVAVDKNSREGCVYVKCAAPENAGRAYRALQGSWFDGKLVTVKYLRLDRYHQRFPAATSCNTPIRPSNNLKKSLSHQSQSSGLECS